MAKHNPLLHDINILLDEVHRHHAILHDASGSGDIEAWSSNVKLPIALRRAIRSHRRELATMLDEADSRICPNPALHRKRGWKYDRRHKRYVCLVCADLDHYIMHYENTCETASQAA